jgi:transcription-repair coupling factor (superfamily II helicase)
MGALPENARQRLAAIRRYTHLGAGFKLALRDLEIRGAGNILGTEQSGHIAAVGFELYCDLLKDAVARLEHEPVRRAQYLPVTLDLVVYALEAPAGKDRAAIPPTYVTDEGTRLECYRRINMFAEPQAASDFEGELRDRFGPPPPEALNLLCVGRIRALARAAGVFEVRVRERRVYMETEDGPLRVGGRLPRLSSNRGAEQLGELVALLRRHAQLSVGSSGGLGSMLGRRVGGTV